MVGVGVMMIATGAAAVFLFFRKRLFDTAGFNTGAWP